MAENFFGQTDTGKVRDNNEDTFIAQYILNKQYILACVIDGVGGYHGGEVAAALAKEEIVNHLEQSRGDLVPDMIDAFKNANAKIYAEKQVNKDYDQMACVATLVLTDLQNNRFLYAHVGDTRLYLLRDGSLVKITNDHSFVGYLEDSGRLTEAAAMKHPKRNEINKALGFSELIETDDAYIETGQSPFLPGDMLLLCSDGLTDMVDKNDITQIITGNDTLEQKTAALIEAANLNGGNDNVTVVLVKNNKVPQASDAVLPTSTAEKSAVSLDKQLPMVEHIPQNETLTPMQPKKSNLLILILGIICLALMASSVWLFMQWQKYAPHNDTATKTIKPARNTQEVLLQDAFDNAKGDTLVLSDSIFKSPILITDTLFIKADSLFIKARGNIILQRDTAYHGPAIVISPTAKLTLLDSLQFSDFPTAIYLNNTQLILRRTSFFGSIIPVVNRFTFEGKSVVTGKISVITTNTDSVNKRHANINGSK